MKAVVIDGHGGPDVLQVCEVPEPKAGPGEVVVEVAAAAVNRMDLFIRGGLRGPGVRSPRAMPHVLGADCAGTIVEIGPSDGPEPPLAVGDPVVVFPGLSCGHCRYCRAGLTGRCRDYAILGEDVWGTQAERVAVPAANVLRAPSGTDLVSMAAAPAAYATAWTMLFSATQLRAGERVLVVGATGGVATAAMQFARHAGAEVLAGTRGPAKMAQLEALPFVDQVIDTTTPGWFELVLERTGGEGVDLIVDAVGAPTWRDCIRSLAMGGRMTICGATGGDTPDISIRELYQSHRQIIGAPLGGWVDFRDAMDLMFRTGMQPVIGTRLPFERVADAHRLMVAGEHLGKIVLLPT